ncbi:MAG TPA: PQQ-dependent sugar dehydrogenase [Thermoanaerobaculia bacterium]|jgi:glucose/arabinose dehydrogenase|nr:PQQ-dependent sugar dehydrogenase [Thermoanaerobaculia bacterium]
MLSRRTAAALLLALSLAGSAFAQAPGPAKGPFTSAGTLPGVRLSLFRSDLSPVTSITGLADSRLFLTLRDGRILILPSGGGTPLAQPFLDLRGQINANDEGGLLSLAFHPRYADNGFFFIFYTNRSGDAVVARYKVSAADPNRADPASARTLLSVSQPFANHNGGQVRFGPDGYLYVAFGDGGLAFDPNCAAQKPDNLLGKMLRLDVDQNVSAPPYYGIPAGNPFRGPGDPPDEVWSLGFRNPWRFSFDRETGDLWIGDVGQNHREEVDFQPAASRGGENYGWKVMEGTLCSTSTACPATTPACDSTAFTAPVLEYDHDPLCAVTSGVVYRGSRLPQLKGAYVFGDFCTGTVWAAFREGTGLKVQTLADRAPQLTYIGEDAAGEIYFAALNGRLYIPTSGTLGGPVDTVGLFDPSASLFQLKAANTEAAAARAVRFGPRRSAWIPLAGDWNGDGRSTPGFYDPAAAVFRFKNSLAGGASDIILTVNAPSANARPVVGDWDGDGKDTVGLYDGTTATFHLKNTLAGPGFDATVQLGTPGQGRVPVAGDWNGDGTDSVGLYDPGTSQFLLLGLVAGGPSTVPFGPTGRNALPVTGDWDGDGKDGLGLYDPASALFRLKQSPTSGAPDLQFRFGTRNSGWKPVAGVW